MATGDEALAILARADALLDHIYAQSRSAPEAVETMLMAVQVLHAQAPPGMRATIQEAVEAVLRQLKGPDA